MEYQKIINLLDNTPNQTCKFSTRKRVEINGNSHGKYDNGKLIRFKTLMIRSSLCDYSDAYIHVKGTITIQNTAAAVAAANNANKNVILKNCAPFANCVSEINNTQVMQ